MLGTLCPPSGSLFPQAVWAQDAEASHLHSLGSCSVTAPHLFSPEGPNSAQQLPWVGGPGAGVPLDVSCHGPGCCAHRLALCKCKPGPLCPRGGALPGSACPRATLLGHFGAWGQGRTGNSQSPCQRLVPCWALAWRRIPGVVSASLGSQRAGP